MCDSKAEGLYAEDTYHVVGNRQVGSKPESEHSSGRPVPLLEGDVLDASPFDCRRPVGHPDGAHEGVRLTFVRF